MTHLTAPCLCAVCNKNSQESRVNNGVRRKASLKPSHPEREDPSHGIMSVCSEIKRADKRVGFRMGYVGRPLIGTQTRITSDGMLEVKGRHVFMGYLRDDEESEKVLTVRQKQRESGWWGGRDVTGSVPLL